MDAEIIEEWGGPFDQPGYCLYKGVFSKWDPELGDEPIKVEEREYERVNRDPERIKSPKGTEK